MSKQIIIYDYLMKFVGLPYIFGGNNPLTGFDCSGLVIEIASAIGLPPPRDMAAQELYSFYSGFFVDAEPRFGSLAFYGKSTNFISHIAFCISDTLMIEAGSGNHTTTTREIAAVQNAFVRIRPIKKRSDLVSIIYPAYPDLITK